MVAETDIKWDFHYDTFFKGASTLEQIEERWSPSSLLTLFTPIG